MYTTFTLNPTPAIVTRADGLAFEPDALRPGWLRCRECCRLVLATKAAIDRHECMALTAHSESEARR